MSEPSTAGVMTLSHWANEGVTVATVLRALEDLRRPEQMPATRTSVLTLCILGRDRGSVDRAKAAVLELGGRHPARVLHLVLDPESAGGPPGLDAEIRLLGGEAEGHELWFEDVGLVVRGPATEHLDSLIEPLTLADLPVVVWFVDEPPSSADPLLMAADVLVVDSRAFGGLDCFADVSALVGARPVIDLSWIRLRPWRELLAGLFEGPDFRPFVHGVHRIEVIGRTGPRHLLGGWIAERLDLPREAVQLVEGEHVTIRLHAISDGRSGTFEVTRGDERRVEARAIIDGGPSSSSVVQLPEATPAWGLADALSHLEHDPVFERALARALS